MAKMMITADRVLPLAGDKDGMLRSCFGKSSSCMPINLILYIGTRMEVVWCVKNQVLSGMKIELEVLLHDGEPFS